MQDIPEQAIKDLKTKSYIKTEDIRSISVKRLVKKLGNVEANIMSLVEDKVNYLLGLM